MVIAKFSQMSQLKLVCLSAKDQHFKLSRKQTKTGNNFVRVEKTEHPSWECTLALGCEYRIWGVAAGVEESLGDGDQ